MEKNSKKRSIGKISFLLLINGYFGLEIIAAIVNLFHIAKYKTPDAFAELSTHFPTLKDSYAQICGKAYNDEMYSCAFGCIFSVLQLLLFNAAIIFDFYFKFWNFFNSENASNTANDQYDPNFQTVLPNYKSCLGFIYSVTVGVHFLIRS